MDANILSPENILRNSIIYRGLTGESVLAKLFIDLYFVGKSHRKILRKLFIAENKRICLEEAMSQHMSDKETINIVSQEQF